jgi:DNA-binding MarR family transcriptional regulator
VIARFYRQTMPAKPSSTPLTQASFEAPKAANLKQLLLARSDWFAEEIMKGVRVGDFAYITPGQSRMLAHMAGKPCSMAELARRLGVSRQAVHKTVMELERRGVLALQDDPQRGNTKLVVYTEKGRQVNRAGAAIIDKIEQRISKRLGDEGLEQLKQLLASPWID